MPRAVWILGGVVLVAAVLLWIAKRAKSGALGPASGGGTPYTDPRTLEVGRARFSDLEWLPPGHPIVALYTHTPGCDSLFHHPTGLWGTLWFISEQLGLTPAEHGATLAQLWGGSPLEIQPGPFGGVALDQLPRYWTTNPPDFAGCTWRDSGHEAGGQNPICPCGST